MEETEVEYFFDTYAIIEIVKQNKNYEPYAGKDATMTIFNLAELYYSVLTDYEKEKADAIYEEYKYAVVETDDETLKEAMEFKKAHKKQDISYTDAIGYIYAKRHNLKFLTGDKEFEFIENVEYVKK
jgi:predicted nucleic acid-binding protein